MVKHIGLMAHDFIHIFPRKLTQHQINIAGCCKYMYSRFEFEGRHEMTTHVFCQDMLKNDFSSLGSKW